VPAPTTLAAAALLAYVDREGLSQAELARRAALTPQQLSNWVQGIRTPGLAAAVRLEQATSGAVRASDWAVPLHVGQNSRGPQKSA
jgi:transcriptional regulator with XRE-family HTH domain